MEDEGEAWEGKEKTYPYKARTRPRGSRWCVRVFTLASLTGGIKRVDVARLSALPPVGCSVPEWARN